MSIDFTYFSPLRDALGLFSKPQIESIQKAYEVAYEAHLGQFRTSGEPYITHPVAVALILAQLELDYETIIAALLHDTIEDTEISYSDIVRLFGKDVALLVEGVSKLDKLKFRNRQEAVAENFSKMILAMTEDVRVILIKFADRTHNIRTLGSLRPDKRRRIAKETLEIFVPLAHRLGIYTIKTELENRSFEAIYPMRASVLKRVVAAAKKKDTHLISKITKEIKRRLHEQNIEATIQPTERTLYDVYQSMVLKDQRFHSIMDVYIFNVIVDNLDNCYRTLGYLHNLYKPKANRFKDYIAVPKTNGYQALHSSLVGPRGSAVNVHIRTKEMDILAHFGIVAHWNFLHSNTGQLTTPQIKIQNWLKDLVKLQRVAHDTLDFVDNVKSDLFPKEIYVFTPKGRIIELPKNATPIDFAYELHTDIGNHCFSAMINHKPAELSTPLQSGQTIEIETSETVQVNVHWLSFVTSSKAKSKIKQTLKLLEHHDAIKLGKSLLTLTLDTAIFKDLEQLYQDVFQLYKINTLDDLYAAIGLGHLTSQQVMDMIEQALKIPQPDNETVIITENENKFLHFAQCCYPVPNDPIIGEIMPGKGVLVHHHLCQNTQHLNSNQRVHLQWDPNSTRFYTAEISVLLKGLSGETLASIISIVNKENCSIVWLHVEDLTSNERYYLIHISVQSNEQIDKIIAQIRKNKDIIHTQRNINQCTMLSKGS